MKRTEHDTKVSSDIDFALRQGEFQHVPLTETSRGTGYAKWYARLLTTLTITLGEQTLVYTQTDYAPDAPTARLILVTDETVVVVDVENITEEAAETTVRMVGRASLQSFEVSASMAIDQDGSSSFGWPGLVEIVATYSALDAPLVYASTGYERGDSSTPGPILSLLEGLQRDLNR